MHQPPGEKLCESLEPRRLLSATAPETIADTDLLESVLSVSNQTARSNPYDYTAFGDDVFFMTTLLDEQTAARENALFRYTPEGTVERVPGALTVTDTAPRELLAVAGDQLLIPAPDLGILARRLDGTTTPWIQLPELNSFEEIYGLRVIDDQLVVLIKRGQDLRAVGVTINPDGTAGTVETLPNVPDELFQFRGFFEVQGRTVFATTQQLFETDGTADGTQLLVNLNRLRSDPIVSGDRLYYIGEDVGSSNDTDLHVTDLTPEGSFNLTDRTSPDDPAPAVEQVAQMQSLGDGRVLITDRFDGGQLWAVDGTQASITPLGLFEAVVLESTLLPDGRAVFRVGDSSAESLGVAISDGTVEGTRVLVESEQLPARVGNVLQPRTVRWVGGSEVVFDAYGSFGQLPNFTEPYDLYRLDVDVPMGRAANAVLFESLGDGQLTRGPGTGAQALVTDDAAFLPTAEPKRFDRATGQVEQLADLSLFPVDRNVGGVVDADQGYWLIAGPGVTYLRGPTLEDAQPVRSFTANAVTLRQQNGPPRALGVGEQLVAPTRFGDPEVGPSEQRWALLDPADGSVTPLLRTYEDDEETAAARLGDGVFVPARGEDDSYGLYRYDATDLTASPTRVLEGRVDAMFELNDALLVWLRLAADTTSVWATIAADGSVGPTLLEGPGSSSLSFAFDNRQRGISVGDRVFFGSRTTAGVWQAFVTDGNPAGTVQLTDFQSTPSDRDALLGFAAVGSRVIFSSIVATDDGDVRQLFSTDGSVDGTFTIPVFDSPLDGPNSTLPLIAATDDFALLIKSSDFGSVWQTDGTIASSRKVQDARPPTLPETILQAGNLQVALIGNAQSGPGTLRAYDGVEFTPIAPVSRNDFRALGTVDGVTLLQSDVLGDPSSVLRFPALADDPMRVESSAAHVDQAIRLVVDLNNPVAPLVDTSAWSVVSLDSGQQLDPATFEISLGRRSVELVFTNSLPNGHFGLTVPADAIWDVAGRRADSDLFATFSFLNGDLNGDRKVDLFDAALLERNFGRTDDPVYAEGDIDFDGDVDLFDAALLERNFATSVPNGSALRGVLEQPSRLGPRGVTPGPLPFAKGPNLIDAGDGDEDDDSSRAWARLRR
ncbi:MAG: dockerin type I domain-containing protein [Planctomycetota bacterium]